MNYKICQILKLKRFCIQLNLETARVLHKQETVPYFAVDLYIIVMNLDITSTERAC
jgi:hypothetical protein